MYQGELVAFRIKGSETLVAVSLDELDSEINENGLLLKYKENGKEIGYYDAVCGISFNEMMQVLGYEKEE